MKENGVSWEEYKEILKQSSNSEPGDEKQDNKKSDMQEHFDRGQHTINVAYIVALEDEFEHLLSAYSIDARDYIEWNGLKYIVFQHQITPEKPLWIAIIKPCGKGLTKAAMCTTQLLLLLKPQLVIMTGICAAPKEKADFGDILIFESVYLHDEGKITPQGRQPEIVPITISRKISDICDRVISSPGILDRIAKKWPEKLTRREPIVAKKVLAASGSSVVADNNYLQQIISYNRSLSAVDMEAYAVAYCAANTANGCDWLILKGVQDNGDNDKKDTYRHYASFTSAMFSLSVVREYFTDYYS